MRRVELSPHAEGDLRRLEDFLIGKSDRSALAAADAIISAIESLADFPDRGRAVGADGRRQLVVAFGRDGYVVRYRVTPTVVFITRIYHGRERR